MRDKRLASSIKGEDMKIFSRLNELPDTQTDGPVTEGCVVLEGGGWRGLYTSGVLDALMENGIFMHTTIGVSAGALNGIGYVTGQLGITARINLSHRNDKRYVGSGAFLHEKSIMGLHHLFDDIMPAMKVDFERFRDPSKDYYALATSLEQGKPVYFSKDDPEIVNAIIASASVPFLSKPTVINGEHYLDGGCYIRIGYELAAEKKYKKIIVVRTQDLSYRKELKQPSKLIKLKYGKYPEFADCLTKSSKRYNDLLDRIDEDARSRKTFVLAPNEPVTVSRFEKDVEKLGELYFKGYYETLEKMPSIKKYLAE